uniref:Pallidipin n=1 Tax=Triatoma brasiliensis TaxID=65344 RepID=Q0MTD5_TRIBS|nr:pallidipin precursor [Triatoma brasiliensis]
MKDHCCDILGILMHAYADQCQLKQPASNFNADQYFSISLAYVTHSKTGQPGNVCRKYQLQKNGNGTSVTVASPDGGTPPGPTVTCTNTPKGGSNGQFSIECSISDGTTYTLTSSVLATDNQNYAVLQRCDSELEKRIFWVIANRINNGVNPQVTKVLFKKQKWDINSWTSRGKRLVC